MGADWSIDRLMRSNAITRSIFGDLSIYRLNDWIFHYLFVCLFEKIVTSVIKPSQFPWVTPGLQKHLSLLELSRWQTAYEGQKTSPHISCQKPHEEKSSSSVLPFCLTALYFYFLVLRTARLSKSRLYNVEPTEIKYNVGFHSWQTEFQTLLFSPRPLLSKLIWRNDDIYLSCLIHEPVSRL